MRSTGHFDPTRPDVQHDVACSPSIGWQCVRPSAKVVEASTQCPSRLTAYTVRKSTAASTWYDTQVRRMVGSEVAKFREGHWKQSNFTAEGKRLYCQLNEDSKCVPSLTWSC
jgi:hypothetical protein